MEERTPQEQIQALEEQLKFAQNSDDASAECLALGKLGIAYYQQEQDENAIAFLKQYLNLAQKLNDSWQEAVAGYYLGFSYRRSNCYDEAFGILTEAYGQFRCRDNLQFADNVWKEIDQLVDGYSANHQNDKARDVLDWQFRTARQWEDISLQGKAYQKLGQFQFKIQQFSEAIASHQQMLDIARTLSDDGMEILALAWLGCDCRELGELTRAIDYFQQRLALLEQRGNEDGKRDTFVFISRVYEKQIAQEPTVECYRNYLQVVRELGNKHKEQWGLYSWGQYWAGFIVQGQ